MKHKLGDNQRPPAGRYLTPKSWAPDLARNLSVSGFQLLWDPCASGAAPWTIGEQLGTAWQLPVVLSDLHPCAPRVARADYLVTPRPAARGAVLTVGNPPYDEVSGERGVKESPWLGHWRRTARPGDAAIWLLSYDALPVSAGRERDLLAGAVQPLVRPHFLLTEQDAQLIGRGGASYGDGLVKLPHAGGKPYLWAIWWLGPQHQILWSFNGSPRLCLAPETGLTVVNTLEKE